VNKSLKIFIAYAYKDTKAKDQLMICLHKIKSEGLISIWYDNEILAGDKWRDVISSDLTDSDILLYLVSADSLASRNCNRELSIALKENTRIIPIILENCDWQNHQLSNFEVLPEKGKPITQWDPESKGWQNVINGIRIAIQKIQCQLKPSSGISEIETDAELVFQQANFLMLLGQIDPAIKAHSQAIELNPCHAEAYRNRGTAYSNKGDFGNAINDFNTAIQRKPNDPATYYSRGIVYGNKGDFDNAINDFSKAIELKPDFAEAYHNRGTKTRFCRGLSQSRRGLSQSRDCLQQQRGVRSCHKRL
jgi:tetratricopeptide (TPR) repeat protein